MKPLVSVCLAMGWLIYCLLWYVPPNQHESVCQHYFTVKFTYITPSSQHSNSVYSPAQTLTTVSWSSGTTLQSHFQSFINYITTLIDHYLQQSIDRSRNTVATGLCFFFWFCFLLTERTYRGINREIKKYLKKQNARGTLFKLPNQWFCGKKIRRKRQNKKKSTVRLMNW